MKKYYSIKLVLPMCTLFNLSDHLEETFVDLNIQDGQKLVLIGQQSFTWSALNKGPNVQLS